MPTLQTKPTCGTPAKVACKEFHTPVHQCRGNVADMTSNSCRKAPERTDNLVERLCGLRESCGTRSAHRSRRPFGWRGKTSSAAISTLSSTASIYRQAACE